MSKKNPKNLQKEPHPIKARRELLGLSQSLLSDKAAVAVPTIQRVEQGLMPTLPRAIYTVLYGSENELTFTEVNFKVESWKVDTRRKNKRYLDYLIEHPETWFNWLEFRTHISQSKAGFCKLYCIHPHVLDHFEPPDKVHKRVRLPDKIRGAFYDSGLSEEEIKLIEEKLTWGVAGREMSD